MIALICGLVVLMLLSPSSAKNAFEEWNEGDEVEITGHSFNEEFWTNPSIENRTENSTSSFAVSYINYADVQIFLVTFNNVTNDNGDVGTFPYQLFGVHYYTPEGREVFIGAIFAFLMAYQDNNSNHLQDPGNEAVYWVVPFGLAKIFSLWLYADEMQGKAAKITAISLGWNIILSLLFIIPLEAIGLALASSLSGFIVLHLTLKEFGYKKLIKLYK